MNYCSIQEAWPSINIQPVKETFIGKTIHNKHDILCDDFIEHLTKCKSCYNKIKYKFKSKVLDNFENIIDENREPIILILIGISFVLFFNLINNTTKS